jgi:hypothetical protein
MDKIDAKTVRKAIKQFVAEGLMRDSGRRKDGEVIWALTERGKMVMPALVDLWFGEVEGRA